MKIRLKFFMIWSAGTVIAAMGQIESADSGASKQATYIPGSLEVPDFTPPAPPVEKKVPAMRVDSSLTVPTKGSRTLTVIRGEASTLPDLPIPTKSEASAQRAPTSEEINQTRIERRHELHLGATVFENCISLVHWQNPETGEFYQALCGFDLGLLEGLGGFVHQSESYSLMLMVSKGETSGDPNENGFSKVLADSIKILQGDPKNSVGVAPIFVIRDLITAEKSRLAIYQAARERYQQAATAWAETHPVVPRSQTIWLRPHRGQSLPRQSATRGHREITFTLFVMKFIFLCLLSFTSLFAQQNGIDQSSDLLIVPEGDKFLHWHGHADRTYFIQVSDSDNPLTKWSWAPVIESGNGEEISYEVGGTAESGFFRLKYTSQVPGPGETVETADFDNDGISNIDEIDPPAPLDAGDSIDPLNGDTDGDGLNDGYERDTDLDPNDDGTVDPDSGPAGDADGDGLSNAGEMASGTDPNNPDSDGDGLLDGIENASGSGTDPTNPNSDGDSLNGVPLKDGDDADPKEVLVNWEKTPESLYLLIDIDAPAGAGDVQDLNEKGEVLFNHGIWEAGAWIPLDAPDIGATMPRETADIGETTYESRRIRLDLF